MHVASILKQKGHAVETARLDMPLSEAVSRLADKRIGAIVVLDRDGSIGGIISERDVVGVLARTGAAALNRPISEIMTRDVLTCTEEDTIDRLMSLMTTRRCRHLPVLANGKLAGIVSIGDVVKHHIAEVEMEAMAMRDYITTG